MKNSIVFYLSQYESIKTLSDEQLGKVYRALFETKLGNEIELEKELIPIYMLLKNQMVLDNQKYIEKCEKNRRNGQLGGRPRKNKEDD